MLTRALIVVLVLLNVSVALWWMLRDAPAVPDIKPPTGVAELQFAAAGLAENAQPQNAIAGASVAPGAGANAGATAPAAALVPAPTPAPVSAAAPAAATEVVANVPAPPAGQTPPPAAAPAPVVERCVAVGPFADEAAARSAQSRVASVLQRTRLQQEAGSSTGTRYRVMLAPAATREEAQATVQRIVAAGLGDYYIIAQGADANAIALGQYRNREGAERRVAAVRAAGFEPQLRGGDSAAVWWLQGSLAEGQSAGTARQRSGAAQQRSLDCAGLR